MWEGFRPGRGLGPRQLIQTSKTPREDLGNPGGPETEKEEGENKGENNQDGNVSLWPIIAVAKTVLACMIDDSGVRFTA